MVRGDAAICTRTATTAGRSSPDCPIRDLTYGRDDRDARRAILHSITSCRAPCNRTTGIAYPLADGPVRFDSGNLGFGPPGVTAAAQRESWRPPRRLRAGTYTYFCRVHPFTARRVRVKPRAARR